MNPRWGFLSWVEFVCVFLFKVLDVREERREREENWEGL